MNRNNRDMMYKVNYLSSDLMSIYHKAAQKFGISDSVMSVLYVLYENGGSCLLTDIRKEMSLNKQTLNSAVRGLERGGIIYLAQNDSRTKMVHLTEKGKTYAAQTVARLFDAESSAFGSWTEKEIAQYLHFMEKYNDDFREQVEKL